MLADIYNWFTEGFDTADLKDAKSVARRVECPDSRRRSASSRSGISAIPSASCLGHRPIQRCAQSFELAVIISSVSSRPGHPFNFATHCGKVPVGLQLRTFTIPGRWHVYQKG
jgi:hypothetical protein